MKQNQRLTRQRQFRLTEAEDRKLTQIAHSYGLETSQYLRNLVYREIYPRRAR